MASFYANKAMHKVKDIDVMPVNKERLQRREQQRHWLQKDTSCMIIMT